MGYVIVQSKLRRSTTLMNYGPAKANVKLKKLENKSDLTKDGIFIEFNNCKNLIVGKPIELHLIFQPKQENYKKRWTNIEHQIYIEVGYFE